MTRPESPSDRFLEDLVRRRLEKESERIDPRPLFERIQSSMEAEANGARIVNRITHTNARPVVWLWTGRIAAAVFLGVGLAILLQNRHVKTRGDVLVREARQAHSLPVDRCYVVEMRRDSALYDECAPMTSQVRLTRLWTRGDRFWVESAHSEHRRAWGRDHEGRFWIAFGPHRAIQLEADETSRWLNLCCDLYGVRLDQVLGDALGNFDLKREETPSDSGRLATLNVQATLKPGRRTANIRSVQLEIDAETRIVRKMVIERVQKGQAFATVTYTLVETGTQRDDTYRLEGHLSNPHEIYTREHEPAKRKDLLIRWFGPESSNVFGQRQPFVDYLPPYKNPFAATTGFSKGSVKMISLRARLGLVAGLALCTVGFVSALGQQRPVIDAERAFAAGDADLDGKLSFEKYREQIRNGPMQKKAALKPALKANPAMAENLFRRCDADSDGYLTLAEYRKLFALRAGGMLAKNVAGKKASGSQPAPTVAASKETPVTPQESKFFKTKIRPVLVNQCAKCHAAGAEKIRGGLLVDSREGLRRGGDTGPAVVPGKPDESLLIQAIRYHDEDLKMPPKVKLPDAMIADFEA